jgi:hypothetical protein
MHIYFHWPYHADICAQAFRSEDAAVKFSFKRIGELIKQFREEKWKK